MTREMKDELLLVMLFLGFLLLFTSLDGAYASSALPSPKAGAEANVADVASTSLAEVPSPSSLLMPPSVEYGLSLRGSCNVEDTPFNDKLVSEKDLYVNGGTDRASKLRSETLVPAVAGCGLVASGFGFTTGASDG